MYHRLSFIEKSNHFELKMDSVEWGKKGEFDWRGRLQSSRSSVKAISSDNKFLTCPHTKMQKYI